MMRQASPVDYQSGCRRSAMAFFRSAPAESLTPRSLARPLLRPPACVSRPLSFRSRQLLVDAVRARAENSRGPYGVTHLLTDLAVVWEGAHERIEAD